MEPITTFSARLNNWVTSEGPKLTLRQTSDSELYYVRNEHTGRIVARLTQQTTILSGESCWSVHMLHNIEDWRSIGIYATLQHAAQAAIDWELQTLLHKQLTMRLKEFK